MLKWVCDHIVDPAPVTVSHKIVDSVGFGYYNPVTIIKKDYTNRGNTKSKAPGSRGSTDYYIYLYNGGKPY